jgi:hypothetical protein
MEAPRCLVCGTKHWSRQPCPAMGKDEKLRHARDVLRQAEGVTLDQGRGQAPTPDLVKTESSPVCEKATAREN